MRDAGCEKSKKEQRKADKGRERQIRYEGCGMRKELKNR